MKKRLKKPIAGLLAVVLFFSAFIVPVQATEQSAPETAETDMMYRVVIEEVDNGRILIDKEDGYYAEEELVKINVELMDNFEVDEVKVEGEKKKIKVTPTDIENEYSFQMPAEDVSISAVLKEVETEELPTEAIEPETVPETQPETQPQSEFPDSEGSTGETEGSISEVETEESTSEVETEESTSEVETEEETELLANKRSGLQRSAEDKQRYDKIRKANNNVNIQKGATIINANTKIPNDYNGYIRKGIKPVTDVIYDYPVNKGGNIVNFVLLKDAYKMGHTKGGYAKARYPKAVYYNGKYYDMEMTLLDWLSSLNQGPKDKAQTKLQTSGKVTMRTCDWVEVVYKFYEAGTNTPANIKGYTTFWDLDLRQGVVLKEGFQADKIYAHPDAKNEMRYAKIPATNYPYFFTKRKVNAKEAGISDESFAVTALFSGTQFKVVYTFNCDKDENGAWVKGAAQAWVAPGSNKLVQGPANIKKWVSDDNTTARLENTLDRKPQPRKEPFKYHLDVEVPYESAITYYNKFEVTDNIDIGLLVDKNTIRIKNEAGIDKTGLFNIGVNANNRLVVKAKPASLKTDGFYGHVYRIDVPVSIKDSTDLVKCFDPAKRMARFDNSAVLDYDLGKVTSNDVTTYVPDVGLPDNYIKVIKKEDGTGTLLSGVTFRIYEWNGTAYSTTVYDTLVEREKGVYRNLKILLYTPTNKGKFKIIETQSAPGYFNSNWSKEITVNGTNPVELSYNVSNKKMDPKLSVAKAFDLTTGAKLVNGRYEGTKVPGWYDFGSKVTATFTARNYGNTDIQNVVISEVLSQELKAVMVKDSGRFIFTNKMKTVKGNEVTVKLDANDKTKLQISELKSGDSLQVQYQFSLINQKDYNQKDKIELLKNTVKITGTYDNGHNKTTKVPEDKDDTDDDLLNVKNPVVEIEKIARKNQAKKEAPEMEKDAKAQKTNWYSYDETFHYDITVMNKGNISLTELIVKDTMSNELKAAVLADKASFEFPKTIKTAKGKVANVTKMSATGLKLDTLAVGDSATLKFVVTVSDRETVKKLAKLTQLVNNVRVDTGEKVGDDSDTPVNIYNPLISITKTANKRTINEQGEKVPGWYYYDEVIEYEMVVKNYGNVDVTQLTVKDTMSEELKAAILADEASFDVPTKAVSKKGNEVVIQKKSNTDLLLNRLAVGDSVTIKFVATVEKREQVKDLATLNELENEVKVTGIYDKDDEPTPVPEDEDDTAKEIVNIYNPLISITKTANKATINEQEEKVPGWYSYDEVIEYEVVVKNYGNVDVTQLAVKDTMSEELKAAILDDQASFDIPEKTTTEKGNEILIEKQLNTDLLLDRLAAGDSVAIKFVATVKKREQVKDLEILKELENEVKVTGIFDKDDEPTPVPEDEDDTNKEIVNIYNPLISITKVANKTTINEKEEHVPGWYSYDEVIEYEMVVTNNGNVDVTQLAVKDIMSEELKAAILAGEASFDVPEKATTAKDNEVLIEKKSNTDLLLIRLAAGDSVTIKFVATVGKREQVKEIKVLEELVNEVKITGIYDKDDEPTPVPEDEDDTDKEIINIYNPLISITKVANKTTINEQGEKVPGWNYYDEVIEYEMVVTNNGNVDVTQLAVKDTMSEELKAAILADEASFDVPEKATTSKGNEVLIEKKSNIDLLLDCLVVGDSVTIKFVATVGKREQVKGIKILEELVNEVKVTGIYDKDDEPTPVPEDEDDTDKEIVNIYNPLMKVTKTAGKDVYDLGETVTYNVQVENYGNTKVRNIVVTDILSKELEAFVKDGTAKFTVEKTVKTANNETIDIIQNDDQTLTLSELGAGDTATVTITLELIDESDTMEFVEIKNTVKIKGEYGDTDKPTEVPEDEDDQDDAGIYVSNPKLAVAKLADKTTGAELSNGRYKGKKKAGTYAEKEKVKWSITVTNKGNKALSNVEVKDSLSKDLKNNLSKASFIYKDGQKVRTVNKNSVTVRVKKDLQIVIDKLMPGDSVELIVEGTIKEAAKVTGKELENQVVVTADDDGKKVSKTTEHEDKDTIIVKTPEKEKAAKESTGTNRTGSPRTGDDTRVILWIILLTLSVVGAAAGYLFKRKRTK